MVNYSCGNFNLKAIIFCTVSWCWHRKCLVCGVMQVCQCEEMTLRACVGVCIWMCCGFVAKVRACEY